MTTIWYQSEFQLVTWDAEKQCMTSQFTEKTAEYTDEIYKSDFFAFKKRLVEIGINQVPFSIADMRKFFFTVSADMQEWHNRNILQFASEVGLKKLAIVLSSDFFAAVSVQQTIDDVPHPFQTEYFDDLEKAEKWLFA